MILDFNAIDKALENLRKNYKKIVFTNGCFDIIHAGHVDYLIKAKALGDVLFVGLNSDSSIKRIKGKDRPIISEHLRAFVLDNLKPVDFVCIFDEDTPLNLIKKVRPDILAKGGDWEPNNIVGKDFVESYGGTVKTIPFVYDISTTKIISKIKS